MPVEVTALTRQDTHPRSNGNIHWRQVPDYSANSEFCAACEGATVLIMLADKAARAAHGADKSKLDTSWINALGGLGVGRLLFTSSVYARLAACGEPSAYGTHKLRIEKEIAAECRVPHVILRLPPVYGEGGGGGFATLAKLVAKFPVLPFGSALAPRAYLSVSNLVDLIVHFLLLNEERFSDISAGIYEPSDGAAISTRDLIAMMAHTMERRVLKPAVPISLLRAVAGIAGAQEALEGALGELVVSMTPSLEEDIGWVAPQKMPETLEFLRER